MLRGPVKDIWRLESGFCAPNPFKHRCRSPGKCCAGLTLSAAKRQHRAARLPLRLPLFERRTSGVPRTSCRVGL